MSSCLTEDLASLDQQLHTNVDFSDQQILTASDHAQFDHSESNEVESNEPVIDIAINNVVCTFSTKCHLNLKRIATEGSNVIFKRENGMVNMKLRRPYVTASIWSSGKVTCTGATSEDAAKTAARRIARTLQGLGFRVRFSNFRIVNVLGTCSLPFGIKITQFSRDHAENAEYEPELHPGVTYRIKEPKATLKIFSTGSITVTAPRVMNIGSAIEHIYPLVSQYQMESAETLTTVPQSSLHHLPHHHHKVTKRKTISRDLDSDSEEYTSDDDDDDFGSDSD